MQAPSESALSRALRQSIAPDQRVLVFGSTVDGEELLLVRCFKKVFSEFPQALVILAPRHPERFDTVAELLRDSGINFWRRSSWKSSPLDGGVLLLDSIGELASIYALADLAFVGGSLAPRGGHNILEPAQFGKPILIGPHYENFREIVRIFEEGGGLKVVTEQELSRELLRLLLDREARRLLGTRAKELFLQNTGATRKTLHALRPFLGEQPQ